MSSVQATTTVLEAVSLMEIRNADRLSVLEGRRLVGVISDRDIIVGCVSARRSPSRLRVRDLVGDGAEL